MVTLEPINVGDADSPCHFQFQMVTHGHPTVSTEIVGGATLKAGTQKMVQNCRYTHIGTKLWVHIQMYTTATRKFTSSYRRWYVTWISVRGELQGSHIQANGPSLSSEVRIPCRCHPSQYYQQSKSIETKLYGP